MNVLDMGRALLRRWLLTVLGLLLTASGVLGAVMWIGPVYEYKSTVLLLPPASSIGQGGNPYLGLSGLDQVVDVVTRVLTAQPVQEQVATQWPKAEYDVQRDVSTSGPILIVTVDGTSPSDAAVITGQLLNMVPATLDSLQSAAGVRVRSRVTSTVLTQYDRPEIVRSDQLRMGLAGLAAGLIGTIFVVALIDRLITARSLRGSGGAVKRPSRRRQRSGNVPKSNKEVSWGWETNSPESGSAESPSETPERREIPTVAPVHEPGRGVEVKSGG